VKIPECCRPKNATIAQQPLELIRKPEAELSELSPCSFASCFGQWGVLVLGSTPDSGKGAPSIS
jgi:hypothetical protein